MELLIILCILCLLAGLALAAAYMMQIGPWKKKKATLAEQVEHRKMFFAAFAADYQQFASYVLECLADHAAHLGLDCPKTIAGIFCQDMDARITRLSGAVVFRYEINRAVYGMPGKSIDPLSRNELDAIEQRLYGHLRSYLDGGYDYTGKVSAWDVGHNRVRIEVHGVTRSMPKPEEDICI